MLRVGKFNLIRSGQVSNRNINVDDVMPMPCHGSVYHSALFSLETCLAYLAEIFVLCPNRWKNEECQSVYIESSSFIIGQNSESVNILSIDH